MTWTEIKAYALSEDVAHHHLAMIEVATLVREDKQPVDKWPKEKIEALAAIDRLHQKYPDFLRWLSRYEDMILRMKRQSEERGG